MFPCASDRVPVAIVLYAGVPINRALGTHAVMLARLRFKLLEKVATLEREIWKRPEPDDEEEEKGREEKVATRSAAVCVEDEAVSDSERQRSGRKERRLGILAAADRVDSLARILEQDETLRFFGVALVSRGGLAGR